MITALHDGTARHQPRCNAVSGPSGAGGLRCRGRRGRVQQSGLQPRRQTRERDLCRPQGEIDRRWPAETGSITASIRKLLALNGLRKRRLSHQVRRWNAGASRLPDRRRLRCGPAGPAARLCRHAARLSAARTFHRGRPRISLYCDRCAALLGGQPTKTPLSVTLARFPEAFKFIRDPARRGEVLKTIVDTTGFAAANAQLTLGALPRARSRRPAQAGRDQHQRNGAGDHFDRRERRHQGAPARGRAVRRSAISARGGRSVGRKRGRIRCSVHSVSIGIFTSAFAGRMRLRVLSCL